MRLFCALAGAALMSLGLSGCGGGGIEEGAPSNVDMTKENPPEIKAEMSTRGPSKEAKAAAKASP